MNYLINLECEFLFLLFAMNKTFCQEEKKCTTIPNCIKCPSPPICGSCDEKFILNNEGTKCESNENNKNQIYTNDPIPSGAILSSNNMNLQLNSEEKSSSKNKYIFAVIATLSFIIFLYLCCSKSNKYKSQLDEDGGITKEVQIK